MTSRTSLQIDVLRPATVMFYRPVIVAVLAIHSDEDGGAIIRQQSRSAA